MAFKIVKNLTTINFTDANNIGRIKYIVIHYFGSLGTAKAVANYFANAYRGASAHLSLDEGEEVYQSVEFEDIAWHCGTTGKYFHATCRNSNSIGIEVRPHKLNTATMNATDKDWYFTQEVIDRLVEVVKCLMDKYNVPIENVIRHYDVTHKYCPRPMMGDDINSYTKESGNKLWDEFKGKLSASTSSNKGTSTSAVIKVGDKVKLANGATQYTGAAIKSSYKTKEYIVKEIKGDRVVLTINGVVIYAVNIKSLLGGSVTPVIETPAANTFKSYIVVINTDTLNVRSGPGTTYKVNTTVKRNEAYTIVGENGDWGKLKSGAGWIHLGYVKKK